MQRMNSASILLMFVAVLFGLAGVFALRKLNVAPSVADPTEAPSLTTVPMASRDLKPGRVVALADVALMSMTKERMRQRNIKTFMADPQQIIGQTVKEPIKRNETFDTEQFYPQGFRPNIATNLKSGQRAVTVLISSEDALNGFASTGQVVDVLFRVSPENARAKQFQATNPGDRTSAGRFASSTVTLLQGVRVLALQENVVTENEQAQQVPEQARLRVTLAVTPAQAETLRVVHGHGDLSLTLRNPNDLEIIESIDTKTLEDILGLRPAEQRNPIAQMEVYRGNRLERKQFDRRHPLAYHAPQELPPGDAATLETQPVGVMLPTREH